MMMLASCTLHIVRAAAVAVAAARIPAVAGVPALPPTFAYTPLHASEYYMCTPWLQLQSRDCEFMLVLTTCYVLSQAHLAELNDMITAASRRPTGCDTVGTDLPADRAAHRQRRAHRHRHVGKYTR